MSDFASAKSASFSQARRSRHSGGVDPNDPTLFGEAVPYSTDRYRHERQGERKCTSIYDQRMFTNSAPSGIVPTDDRSMHKESAGHPIYGEEISAEGHAEADRIRRRER